MNTNQNANIDPAAITKVFALGGLDEVGKNTYCIEHDQEMIILDAGVKFPRKIDINVDAIVPDYSYLVQNNQKIKALLITHGHEDHIGGIPLLLEKVNIPVIYAPRLAAALIRERLKEKKRKSQVKIREYNSGSIIKTNRFNIKFFPVNHSIPDAFGIAVETPNGLIVSTGDYKFDWTPLGHMTDIQLLANMGEQGVKLLMADSTNSELPGYTKTEKVIVNNLKNIFASINGRILISTFASNVHRIQKIVELCHMFRRKIVVLGRSLEKMIRIISEMGHLKIRNDIFIAVNEAKKYEDHQLTVLCTGSQGEALAALSRIANMSHPHLKIKKTDTVILSSSAIPGNYMEVENIVNLLIKNGATVIENSQDLPIHTSGHASQEEQKLLFTLLKPQFFMPMHGDYRMLKIHGETAVATNVDPKNIFLCANGDQINLYQDQAWIGERIAAEPIYVTSENNKNESSFLIRDREIMSHSGMVTIVLIINWDKKMMVGNPSVISRGSFYSKNSVYLINELIKTVNKVVSQILHQPQPSQLEIKRGIVGAVSPLIYRLKKRNPIIVPIILD